MTAPFWISAFLDRPAPPFARTGAFWSAVTGYHLSGARGEHGEFTTLVPPNGDDFLRLQRVRSGPGGLHLDLHVTDPRAAAAAAVARGATQVAERGHVVMRSPGGFAFCFVTKPAHTRPQPMVHRDGNRSIVDQVCLDMPATNHDNECAFWSAITGWELVDLASPEFGRLACPPDQPLRFLLQRLGEDAGAVRGHLDLATDDRPAEVIRHQMLGATLEAEHARWTVLRDPAGTRYCVTDRSPDTGLAG